MKKRNTFVNIINTLFTQFYLIGTGFILSILITRELGVQNKGILATAQILPMLITGLMDMGVRQSTAYYYARNKESKEYIFGTILIVWFFTSILSCTIVFLVISSFYNQIYIDSILYPLILTIPLTLFCIYFRGILQGTNQIYEINKSRRIHQNITISLTLLVIFLTKLKVESVLWIEFLAFFFMSIVVFKYSIKGLSKINFKKINYWIIKIIRLGLSYSIAVFVIRANYRLDTLLLSKMQSPSDVGIFSIGTTISELLWQVPGAIGVVLFSKNIAGENHHESTIRTIKLVRVSIALSLFVGLCLFILSPVIVPLLYGEAFLESAYVVRILLPGIIAMTIFQILNTDLNSKGKPFVSLKVFSVGLILNLFLNIILIPKYSFYGASISTVIVYITCTIFYIVAYAKINDVDIKDIIFIKRSDIVDLINLIRRGK